MALREPKDSGKSSKTDLDPAKAGPEHSVSGSVVTAVVVVGVGLNFTSDLEIICPSICG